MSQVYVIGNGQLGRMLRQAGEPIGITVIPIGLNNDLKQLSFKNSVITHEIEQWSEHIASNQIIKYFKTFVNYDILPILTDRLLQKELCNKLKLSVVPWKALNKKNEWIEIFHSLTQPVIVKRRSGGYNGHEQWRLLSINETSSLPDECYGKCIVEKNINFINEVSLIGARDYGGHTVFYPLTYNLHKNGILKISVVSNTNLRQQIRAESMLSTIMHELDYIGIMVMECFITDQYNDLLVNELAPRVHNSGHWTQNGASISQFELHLRAITHLPLPQPVFIAPSVMINLIGIQKSYDWLKFPTVRLHWYDKKVFPGRKVGHLNIVDTDIKRLLHTLQSLAAFLPKEYSKEIIWAQEKLTEN